MYNDIKEQFIEVIRYSQCIPDPQVDTLFARWEKAKSRFIERFGGLIYEWPVPVEFTLDPKEKRNRAIEFVDVIDRTFNNSALVEFLDLNIDTFFDNSVSNTCGNKVPAGMKLIKAFKYFESDKKALRDMQDMASQLIQENKLKGTLCFSVHPLDFLSSSENTYNWRSCHALDGEYRAGNLSYMVDETTIMVYLKGAGNVQLPSFGDVKWNSKKWRMLIHISPTDEIMFAGRQYPFNSTNGMEQVLNIYNNIYHDDPNHPFYHRKKYLNWQDDYIDGYVPHSAAADSEPIPLDDKYLIYGNKLVALWDVVKQGYGARNYNDVLHSTCYLYPYYAILDPFGYHSPNALKEHPIIVGDEVTCLHCGEDAITNSETMRCNDCEMEFGYEENDCYGSCANCGARIYLDDAPCVGRDNELVCDHCFDVHCFICDECGEAHYNDNKRFIKFANGDEGYVCQDCYEHLTEQKERF